MSEPGREDAFLAGLWFSEHEHVYVPSETSEICGSKGWLEQAFGQTYSLSISKLKQRKPQTETKLLLAYRSLFEKIEILEATAMWLKQIFTKQNEHQRRKH
ncbi:hypothetical protein C4D60_Mb02t21660 [Musa balbisiana]|uniref:Uncharacterized protein n=1 Tax=Musa balbisiana TaxID=52838 RepID=A0A4S8ICE5_MUSBA|nr:hypothetical protein C4D60_Mb02t21660 [Musa balbisiana]